VERVADHIAIMDLSVLRVCCPLETFRERIKRFRLTFAGEPPRSPAMPGLLECVREGQALRVLLTDSGWASVNSLAPISVEELPVSLEEAVVAYLRDRGLASSLLEELTFAGAPS
jgi:hypothetical protein